MNLPLHSVNSNDLRIMTIPPGSTGEPLYEIEQRGSDSLRGREAMGNKEQQECNSDT